MNATNVRVALATLCLSTTGGCAYLTGPTALDQHFRDQYVARQEANAISAAHHRQRQKFLLSCGAMDPLDRLENEVYRERMRAKYGLDPTPQKLRSQRCQDYLANKITIDEAVERGPGADEPKPQRTGITQP